MADGEIFLELRDIHMPPSIGWWPLAPGWYLLSGLVVAAVLLSCYLLSKRYTKARAKSAALKLLQRYYDEYQQCGNSQQMSMKISALLRRVALAYFPRQQVASLQGEAWLDFLTHNAKGIDFSVLQDYLLIMPYQTQSQKNLKPLFEAARAWIKQQGKSCSI